MASVLALAVLVLPGCESIGADRTPNTLTRSETKQGWQLLFDGESLDGWNASGNLSAWGVEDGELVVVAPGRGGWLRTDRMFRDFELVLDFNVPPGGNSGVGLRGSSHGDPAFTGFEVQILDTHGQEPNLTNCGAVYDAIPPDVMAVNPAGEWNTYRIVVMDDTINAWLNGKPIHVDEPLDDRGFIHEPKNVHPLNVRMPTGYISLQDHGDRVRFRNIRIRDLSPDPDHGGYRELIVDDQLANWFATGSATWTVEDGAIVGRDGPGHLFTHDQFGDLEIRALVKVNERGNSGLYFRVRPNPDNRDSWPTGFEAQVDNHDPKNFTGCIYDRAWADACITRDEAWFDYRILADGDRIRTWINGKPMVDAQLYDFLSGGIALQGHHQGNVIMYKDVRVRELE